MPKCTKNTFDSRAPHGPAGGAYTLPQPLNRNGEPTSKWRERRGEGAVA